VLLRVVALQKAAEALHGVEARGTRGGSVSLAVPAVQAHEDLVELGAKRVRGVGPERRDLARM
jgi:hypothetical protein